MPSIPRLLPSALLLCLTCLFSGLLYSATVLQDGQTVSGLVGETDSEAHFMITVPEGSEVLKIELSGGTGDADLYLRHDTPPTIFSYDHGSFYPGNDELIAINGPEAGDWHIMISAFEAYEGLSLYVTHTASVHVDLLEVSNVVAGQRTEGKMVDITYDLEVPANESATVIFRVSRDGGQTFEAVPLSSLTGAIGPGQQSGTGKALVWNAGATEWDSILYPNVQIQLTASIGEIENEAMAVYTPGDPAPLTTLREEKSGTSVDGSEITVALEDSTEVFVGQLPEPFDISLARESLDAELQGFIATLPGHAQQSLEPTGAQRELVISGSGDPSELQTVITFPRAETGSVNLDTVSVLRVGDIMVDEQLVENHAMLLPAFVDGEGNLSVFDPAMSSAVFPLAQPMAASASSNPESETIQMSATSEAWSGSVKYQLVTYERDVNWQKHPQLIRMQPDPTAPGNRRVWTEPPWDENAPTILGEDQPFTNIIILVHGHNENEKGGTEEAEIEAPWEMNYKRLVWELFYDEISAKTGDAYRFPNIESTIFYEFIYPTYRPIFSPVSDKTGARQETLGEAMGRLVQTELQENAQLRYMIENDMPFNLFVVSHSMGGLVSRSGFRHMPGDFINNLKQFVSWGTPHHGAALYSLRYALGSGHSLYWDGYKFPIQTLPVESGLNWFSKGILDTPSKRDMRWDASLKNMLRLGEIFEENNYSIMLGQEMELPSGSFYFSSNLQTFNETESNFSFSGHVVDQRYTFISGETSKKAELRMIRSSWTSIFLDAIAFGVGSTSIEQGAFLNWITLRETDNTNDGAVPLYSQEARGFRGNPSGGTVHINLGDVDHEEFYGAEPEQRNWGTIRKGSDTAYTTLSRLRFSEASRAGPTIEVEQVRDGENGIVLEGRLNYPLYDPEHSGDGEVGDRVYLVMAHNFTENTDGSLADEGWIIELTFEMSKDGSFVARPTWEGAALPNDEFVVVASLKDWHSEVVSEPIELVGGVTNEQSGATYHRIQTAIDSAQAGDTLRVAPGIYKESIDFGGKNLRLYSEEGAEVTEIIPDIYTTVTIRADQTSSTEIDGFTIRDELDKDYPIDGILIEAGASPVIRNCILRNLKTGISVNEGAAPQILNCRIADNSTRGVYAFKSNPTIQNCVIENNESTGIYFRESTGQITGNTIRGNSRGGIDTTNSSCQITGNVIENNTSSIGGGIFVTGNSRPHIQGNIIRNNHATHYGGGVVGSASNWQTHETVQRTVEEEVQDFEVRRHMPPFDESSNSYSGNTHGSTTEVYGPGLDNLVPGGGSDVWITD